MKLVPKGNGRLYCTEHAHVFLAFSSIFGIKARQVFHNSHTFNEFYDNTLNKWIWIDPQFALIAKDKNGNYLSLVEIRNLYYKNEKISFECFGNNYHVLKNINPLNHFYYDEEKDFSDIKILLGNNVFQVYEFKKKYASLPKPIRQLIGHAFGIYPKYLMYVDENNRHVLEMKIIKMTFFAAITLIALLNTFILTYRFIPFLRHIYIFNHNLVR
jgi:hypothetical protein